MGAHKTITLHRTHQRLGQALFVHLLEAFVLPIRRFHPGKGLQRCVVLLQAFVLDALMVEFGLASAIYLHGATVREIARAREVASLYK